MSVVATVMYDITVTIISWNGQLLWQNEIYSEPLHYSSSIKPTEKKRCSKKMDKERRGSLSEIEGTDEFSKGVGPLQLKATTKVRLQRLIHGNWSSIDPHHGNWRRNANCLCLQITD